MIYFTWHFPEEFPVSNPRNFEKFPSPDVRFPGKLSISRDFLRETSREIAREMTSPSRSSAHLSQPEQKQIVFQSSGRTWHTIWTNFPFPWNPMQIFFFLIGVSLNLETYVFRLAAKNSKKRFLRLRTVFCETSINVFRRSEQKQQGKAKNVLRRLFAFRNSV